MLDPVERQKIAMNVWTARIVPFVLAGIVGYATYVLVALLAVNYLLVKHDDRSAAIPILVIYFILFLLMASSFFRLVYMTIFDPPYVPLGPAAIEQLRQDKQRTSSQKSEEDGLGGQEYNVNVAGSKDDPDSPGLELFYTKEVFVADMDGKPRWCGTCLNWKPDRTHHCSASGRCIRKMDHFCPWVGGPVGENNLKFFIQFTTYAALYCLNLIVIMAYYVHQQIATKGESVNRQFAAILGLAGLFFLFTYGMSSTALWFAMNNLTQVESLGYKTRVYSLAILKPSQEVINRVAPMVASQLSYPEISYPLGTGQVAAREQIHSSNVGVYPQAKLISHLKYAETVDIRQAMEQIQGQSPASILNSSQQSTEGQDVQASPHPLSSTEHIGETPSQRDLKATRTFAILKTNPGENPWDLGSSLRNLGTVFGTNVIDWILPIRRSPCCNHEGSESQFAIGPWVDRMQCNFGFIRPEDLRPIKDIKPSKSRRRAKSRGVDNVLVTGNQSGGPVGNGLGLPSEMNGSIGMQTLNGHSVPAPAG